MFYKLIPIIGFVCLSFSISSCVVADGSAGEIVSSNQNVFYASPNSDNKISINSSPVIFTGLSSGSWQQVIAMNGQVAWAREANHSLGTVLVKSRTKPLDLTVNSTESNPASEHKWLSIDEDLNWQLTGASRNTYTNTPAYIKDQGRMNLLPEGKSPYQLPEVEVKSRNISGWAKLLDLEFTTNKKLNNSIFYGIILQPFIGMLHMDLQKFRPSTSIAIKNFAYSTPQITHIPPLPWQLQSLLIIPPTTKSELQAVGLASDIKHQSYLLTLLWSKGQVSYVGFSGITDENIEKIPTPVLVNFKLEDTNHDGADDIRLEIGQITGDEGYIENIQINGKFSTTNAGIKLINK
jgi:hypothetical protein